MGAVVLVASLLAAAPAWAEERIVNEPGTLTSRTLRDDVSRQMLTLAATRLPEGCRDAFVTPQVVEGSPDPTQPWVEQWRVDGCGRTLRYQIHFTPDGDPSTGTTYEIQRVSDEPTEDSAE